MNRYRYHVSIVPTPGIGMKEVEVTAADQAEADEKAWSGFPNWLQGWADRENTPFEWKVTRDGLTIRSGVAEPKTPRAQWASREEFERSIAPYFAAHMRTAKRHRTQTSV